MGEIGHYNYPGFSLEQKHAWFQSGPGAQAAIQVSDSLKRIAARLDVSDATIGAGFIERNLGTSWEGAAAKAASGAFDRAAVVLASLSTSSLSGGGSAQRFGDSFSATKSAIAPPRTQNWLSSAVGDDVAGALGGLWSAGTDQRATAIANQNADIAANIALQNHENTTREVLAGYQSAAASTQPTAPPAPGAAQASAVGAATALGMHAAAAAAGAGAGSTHAAGAPGGGSSAGVAGATGAGHSVTARDTARSGAGGSAAVGAAGGTSSAGAGAGSQGGTAGAGSAGWTPLRPVPGPSGMTPGPNGGYVPSGNTYSLAPPPWPASSGGAGSYAGGYRNTGADQALPPRTGNGEPNSAMRGGTGAGAAAAAGARGPGQGAMAPMGMGGAGAGGRGRDHRNQFYIPEDEPFRVEFDFYVAPPVIGADAAADQRDDR